MTTDEDRLTEYLDSLETSTSEFKITPKPEVGRSSTTQSLSDCPTLIERIQFMINTHGGVENFFEKVRTQEIDLKVLLEEHHITESDLDKLASRKSPF